jgi:hypothetical protein
MPRPSETSSEHSERRLAEQRRNRRVVRVVGPIIGSMSIASGLLQMTSGSDATASAMALWLILLLGVAVMFSLLVTRFWLWPRKRAKLAQEVLAADHRPPIVYLRPFEADRRKRWYEHRIARGVKALGPVVTVGRPEEKYPATPHIARRYLLDEEWRAHVLDLMRQAELVIVHVGTSAGLAWELEQAVGLGRPERLVVCLGPDAVPRLGGRRDAGAPYRQFNERFGRVFPKGLPQEPGRSAFLTFSSDWTPVPSIDLNGRGGHLNDHLHRMHRSLARVRLA